MDFDPHAMWLGIPPERRPPTHYDLLGLPPFEADPETINQAALRRIAKIRQLQIGSHSDHTQDILTELARARLVLSDPDLRAAYDRKLRAGEVGPAPRSGGVPGRSAAATQPPGDLLSDLDFGREHDEARISLRPPKGRQPRHFRKWLVPMIFGLAQVALLIGVLAWKGLLEWPDAAEDAPTAQPAPPATEAPRVVTREAPRGGSNPPTPRAESPSTEPARPGSTPTTPESTIRPPDEIVASRPAPSRPAAPPADDVATEGILPPAFPAGEAARGGTEATKPAGRDPVAEELDEARSTFVDELEKAKRPVIKSFDDLLAKPKKSGTQERLRQLREEKAVFEKEGKAPRGLEAKIAKEYQQRARQAVQKWKGALTDAKVKQRAAGRSEAVAAIDRELDELRALEVAIEPAPAFDRGGQLVLLRTAEEGAGPAWLYTTEAPRPGWNAPVFDATGWARGVAAFASPGTPNVRIGTPWMTRQIWLRTTVEVPKLLPDDIIVLRHRHDEQVEIYADGNRLVEFGGWNNDYQYFVLNPGQMERLHEGRLTLAANCQNAGGGQAFDLGLAILRRSARDKKLDEPTPVERRHIDERRRTDSQIFARSQDGFVQGNRLAFKCDIDLWAEVMLDGDKSYIDRAFGKRNLLCTHPFDPNRPATLDFSKLTENRVGQLQLLIHGYPGRPEGGKVIVKVNQKSLPPREVLARDGWVEISIPFNRESVVVEHHAIGWNMEHLYFDYAISFK